MPHNTFCLRCQGGFPTTQMLGAKLFRTRNNRAILKGFCPSCNGGVARMVSNRDLQAGIQGSGLLGSLIGLIPGLKSIGSKIPF